MRAGLCPWLLDQFGLGPRQSGKTTLVRAAFPEYTYVSLEDLEMRRLVRDDYRGFLAQYENSPGVILDEVQHVPDLLSYMQTHIDSKRKRGHYVLTGFQNLMLTQSISQSLAGRIGILTLLPLSLAELPRESRIETVDEAILRGCYPALCDPVVQPVDWYRSYITTYIERDVRSIQNVIDLDAFQMLLMLCAGRVGQILDYASLSNDMGVSVAQIKQWISVLQASYIIFLLPPYYKNVGKTLIKSPKIYFYDTGVAASLLGIATPGQFFTHYARGGLFESYMIGDFAKQYMNQAKEPALYFWRDTKGFEVDCIIGHSDRLRAVEIKVSQVYNPHVFDTMKQWNEVTGVEARDNTLVYAGAHNQSTPLGRLVNWRDARDLVNEVMSL